MVDGDITAKGRFLGSELPEFPVPLPNVSLPLAFQQNRQHSMHHTISWVSSRHDGGGAFGPKITPRVGIAWQATSHSKNHKRSMPLPNVINDLSPNFDWYSLQIQASDEDIEIIKSSGKMTHFGEMIGDFAETAAFCSVLDAVISVDTSIAHLAGAIDRPVHLLLAYVADARWHDLRSDSPWYPSLSIHRQKKDKRWQTPLVAAQNTLSKPL